MAATIARAQGYNKKGAVQNGQATRLGHGAAYASANTWQTFAEVHVQADGSGRVEVRRGQEVIHSWAFGPEGENA